MSTTSETILFYFSLLVVISRCQDYEVADVKCNLYGDSATGAAISLVGPKQQLVARLKKPEYFRGHPLFADDLKVNPRNDPYCSIVSEPGDISGRIYRLTITDLSRCGVTHHSGYVHVRIWFPLLSAAMTSHDQEVILVCKPPESTILTSRVTELASTAPRQARVSGVVEESSSKLEYQVAVYRYLEEGQIQTQRPQLTGVTKTSATGPYLLPLDEAVPIGTKLQLRTHISPQSAWKYVKLVEVTVSTDRQDPHAEGHVRLLHLSCLTPEMKTLMRGQAKRLSTKPSEVWLDFEAFLLAPSNYVNESKRARRQGQQWIHTTVLACLKEEDCRPGACGDPADPDGYGRRKRAAAELNETAGEIQFDNRLAIQILLPEEKDVVDGKANCGMWIIPVGILISTTVASLLLLLLTCRWNAQKKKELAKMGLHPSFSSPQRNFQLQQSSSR